MATVCLSVSQSVSPLLKMVARPLVLAVASALAPFCGNKCQLLSLTNKKATKIKQKVGEREGGDCREGEGRGRDTGRGSGSVSSGGRVNDVATCFSLAASMMMADYRLHRVPTTGCPCPLPLLYQPLHLLLFPAVVCGSVVPIAKFAPSLPACLLPSCLPACFHKRLQLHANKPSVFVSAFV